MSQERQYERKITTQSEAIKTTNLRDNSITDITIIDFDTATLCRDARQCVSTLGDARQCVSQSDPMTQNIRRLTCIRRQNNIQTTQSDSTVIQTKDSLKSNETVQNKSSPDKSSQATTIIIILLILLAIIFVIMKWGRF